jgi:hypothetical protein
MMLISCPRQKYLFWYVKPASTHPVQHESENKSQITNLSGLDPYLKRFVFVSEPDCNFSHSQSKWILFIVWCQIRQIGQMGCNIVTVQCDSRLHVKKVSYRSDGLDTSYFWLFIKIKITKLYLTMSSMFYHLPVVKWLD